MNMFKKNPLKIYALVAVVVIMFFHVACQRPAASDIDFEKEREKIKAVIANETETYYKQDFEGWKANFLNDPAFRQYSYWEGWPQKIQFHNGFSALEAFKKAQFEEDRTLWKGSRETRENENIRIGTDMAWYTFEQNSYEKDTDKFLGRSLETRILEKVNGEWKIAYLGYHYFPEEVKAN
jgi:hypothetical protein